MHKAKPCNSWGIFVARFLRTAFLLGKAWRTSEKNESNSPSPLFILTAGEERVLNWFRKNKSMEKSEEDLLEHRTDRTDAFDTLYIGCEKFPQHEVYPLMVSGVL